MLQGCVLLQRANNLFLKVLVLLLILKGCIETFKEKNVIMGRKEKAILLAHAPEDPVRKKSPNPQTEL